jgi:DNA-directed RNA polymerase specialized sigma24 family protein
MTDADLLARYQAERSQRMDGPVAAALYPAAFWCVPEIPEKRRRSKDAVQQIFLKVLTDVERHHGVIFKSWLYMVAKNHCLMRLRAQQGKKPTELTDNMPLPHEDLKKRDLLENEATYLFWKKPCTNCRRTAGLCNFILSST